MGRYCNGMIKDRQIQPRSKWSGLTEFSHCCLVQKMPRRDKRTRCCQRLLLRILCHTDNNFRSVGGYLKFFKNIIHVPLPDVHINSVLLICIHWACTCLCISNCLVPDSDRSDSSNKPAAVATRKFQLHLDEEGLREERVMNLEQNMGDSSPRA